MNRPTIHTARLTLRPLAPPDAPDLHRLVSAAEVAYNTLRIPHPYPEGAADEWIAFHEKELQDTDEIVFAIVVRNSNEFAGAIGLVPKPFETAEIGYWIGVPYWGRGYATEAAGAVIHYAFDDRGFNRVEAAVFVRNPASARVLEKCGMRLEGVLRQSVRKGDEYLDTRLYSILRSEWSPQFQR